MSEAATGPFRVDTTMQRPMIRVNDKPYETHIDTDDALWHCDRANEAWSAAGGPALQDECVRLREALTELLEVADLRGDSDLPHPSKDPKLWTSRMQEAWDNARTALATKGAETNG